MSSGFEMDMTGSKSSSDGAFEDSDSDCDVDLFKLEGHPSELHELYFVMHHTRYFVGRDVVQNSKDFVRNYFDGLGPRVFRQMVRMDKSTFFYLVELVENNPIFVNKSWHDQAPIEWQLAITLDRCGHDGNGACLNHMIPTWGISNGSLVNFTKRCFDALEVALCKYLQWPKAVERHEIQQEFAKLGFPDYIGLIDGSTPPLAQRPTIVGERYFDRKSRYSINAQVVCDHRRKILFLFTGMLGTCSDLVCLKKSPLWLWVNNGTGFTDGQYLLGDSGYVALPHMAAAYKRADTSVHKEDFNSCVAKCRVTNEHCIGVLKSHWHSLKELRTQLNLKKDNVFMICWIGICANLHNFVQAQHDEWTKLDSPMEIDQEVLGLDKDHPVYGPQLAGKMLQARVMNHALAFHRAPGRILHDLVNR